MAINTFDGRYRFLSNFYPANVVYEEVTYPSVENAYQAAKTLNKKDREQFTIYSPNGAKRLGRKLELRSDWTRVRLGIMRDLVHQKFANNPGLGQMLLNTGDELLTEGNYWHDNYWGNCTCGKRKDCSKQGRNNLGKILMQERNKLSKEVKRRVLNIWTVKMPGKQQQLKNHPGFLDASVATGVKAFAPTWNMVKGFKAGTMSAEEYTEAYVTMMRRSVCSNAAQWLALIEKGDLIIGCYCEPFAFCHRVLLAGYVSRLAWHHGYVVTYRGEWGTPNNGTINRFLDIKSFDTIGIEG